MEPEHDPPWVHTWPCLPPIQAYWGQSKLSSSSLQTAACMWQSQIPGSRRVTLALEQGPPGHQQCNYLWKFRCGSESCHGLRSTKVAFANQSDWTSGLSLTGLTFPSQDGLTEPGCHLSQLVKTVSLHRGDAKKGWKEERTQFPTQSYKQVLGA